MFPIDLTKLIGHTVYLEKLEQSHVDSLRQIGRDERIWEFTKTILINKYYEEQFNQYISAALPPNPTVQGFIIRQVKDHCLLGTTRFYDIDEKNKRLNIGYTWYIPAVWGKAHNKECKLLLLQYVFEVLKFNRAGFEVAHQNIRSQKAMEKIGATKEGVLRNHGYRGDGSLRDTVIFSIINAEWPDKKKKLMDLIITLEK
ncbi:MAG: GNAT family protein [Flavisolibacter sp.]